MNKRFIEVPRPEDKDSFAEVDENQIANVSEGETAPETYTKVGKLDYVKANAKPLGQGFLAGTIFGGLAGSIATAKFMGRYAKAAIDAVDEDEDDYEEDDFGTEESNDDEI